MLRGIAALAVLSHHVLEESAHLFHGGLSRSLVLAGASGVDIFFVISGFIMFYTNTLRFGEAGAPQLFFKHRLLRIAPLYWICTAAILVLHWMGLYRHLVVSAISLIGSFLFIETGNTILGVGWTLNYEMYFYLIFAFSLAIKRLRLAVCFLFLVLFLCLSFGRLMLTPHGFTFLGNPISIEFCYGVTIALYYRKLKLLVSGWKRLALFLAAVGGIVLACLYTPHSSTAGLDERWRFAAWGLPAAWLVISSLDQATPRNLAGRISNLLGNSSYSLYLTHPLVMVVYARVILTDRFAEYNPVLVVTFVLLISMLIGFGCYFFLELPLASIIKRRRKPDRHIEAVIAGRPAPVKEKIS